MRSLASEADTPTRLYFTGGATAVLLGWRESTIDLDIRIVPESDRLYRAIPLLKESLQINVELACPADFIPELPEWQQRSVFISTVEKITYYHYDLYAQALAKIERSHAQDIEDVRTMIRRRLIEPSTVLRHFETIEPELFRYPAIDPRSFRRAVEEILLPKIGWSGL